MGCKISIKIHPEDARPAKKPLSPYRKILKSIERAVEPVFRKRGNPNSSVVSPTTTRLALPKKRTAGALFVGIDQYEHWPTLDCAVKDATALNDHFTSMGYSTTLLVNEEATCSRIQEAMEYTVSKYDLFVIGFFGHGIAPVEVGGLFIPVDAGSHTHAYDKIHSSSLRTISERSKATSGLFILDFCYSGAFLTEKRKRGSWEKMLQNERARIVLTSGLSHQRVDDDQGSGHSPFTTALLRCLINNKDTA